MPAAIKSVASKSSHALRLTRYDFCARRGTAELLRCFSGLGATPGTFNPNASAMRRARSADSVSALSSSLGEGISRLLRAFAV